MSEDSGVGFSIDQLNDIEQGAWSQKDEAENKSRGEASVNESRGESITPVSSGEGIPITEKEESKQAESHPIEPEIRRGPGRPKGAKNKNPKPKPPPKPKRPIGRPRKYTYSLQTRFTRQHPYDRIEPVSDMPPDDIFEDGS